jgi:hypothetical protein
MEKAYPPPGTVTPELTPDLQEQQPEPAPTACGRGQDGQGTLDVPPVPEALLEPVGDGQPPSLNWTKKPWKDRGIPAFSADPQDDIGWALANRDRCIRMFLGKPTVIEWGKAKSDPPSNRAEAYLEAAAMNPQKFLFEIVPETTKDRRDDEEQKNIRGERKSIAELEKILEQFEEGA